MKIQLKIATIVILTTSLAFITCGGDGGGSETNATAPLAPGAAAVTAGNSKLSLSWEAVESATAYEVWSSETNDSSSAVQNGGDITSTNHVITNLTNGTTYYVWLKAKNPAGTSDFGPVASGTPLDTFGNAGTIGDVVSITVGSEKVNMIYASNSINITFPTGVNDDDFGVISRKFFMSETEVTNALMVEVLQWAYNNGKFSTDVTDHNGLDTTTAKYGTQELLDLDNLYIRINYDGAGNFLAGYGFEDHPVVCVTWYGAIMFCNWLTEMQDGNTDNVVYSGITNSWASDDTVANDDKTGCRLPTTYEWEYAARYIDGTNWTYGDHVSGDDSGACYDDGDILGGLGMSSVFGNYAWYFDNSGLNLQPVKQKTENHLGIFDMSGNVWEWCFSKNKLSGGSLRIYRGGAWNSFSESLQVGYWLTNSPTIQTPLTGFRFSKTQ